MDVVGKHVLDRFLRKHPGAAKPVQAWLAEAEEAIWKSQQEVSKSFPAADFPGNNVVVFDLRHNQYRILALVAYKTGVLRVMKAGTHAEYERWIMEATD